MATERPLGAAAPELLLAIESAGRAPSAALLRGDEPLAQAEGPAGRHGAESLLPCIDTVLRRAGVGLDGVDAFAVAVGPGSFTGLRVGLSTLKGLAFGSSRPVAAVSTLAALSLQAPEGAGPVVALLDARRGELYAGGFRVEAGGDCVPLEPREGVYAPEELAPLLPDECLLVGEGVVLAGERLRRLAGRGIALGASADAGALAVGRLGRRLLARGQAVDAVALVPRYLRRAEAEVRRTGQRFEERA